MEKINDVTNKLEDVFPNKLNGYTASNGRTYKGWFEKYPILNNSDVKKWIENKMNRYARSGKDPKDFQVTSYLNPLQKYCDFYDVDDPSELLEEPIDERNQRLLHYLGELIRNGKNEATVRNAYQSRIKSFYSSRGSPISDGLETVSSGVNHNEIHLSKEQIKLIQNKLERAEYRLILKIQALTGLRINDVLCTLTKKENGESKYKIRKYEKNGNEYYYIPKFKTKKEQVIINFLFFPKELSDLFKATYGITDLTELELSEILKTRNGTRINSNDYLTRIKEITEEIGLNGNIKTHSFRKYFSNQISSVNLTKYNEKIGADFENKFKEHLMGHKLGDLSNAYKQNLKSIESYFELWKPLQKAICIDCEIIDETDKRIETLQDKYDKLLEEVSKKDKKLQENEKQVKELAKVVQKQQKLLEKLISDKEKELQ